MMTTTDHRAITRQLAGLVATEMGEGWTVDTSEAFADHAGVYLDGPDAVRIFVRLDWRNSDRVEVSGIYPKTDAWRLTRHEIGVARDRGPAVIAKEIRRRLLPAFMIDLAKVIDGNQRAADAATLQAAAVAELVEALPLADGQAGRISFHTKGHDNGYGNVDLYHDGSQGSLEIRSAPFDLLIKLARVIADHDA